LMMANKTTMRTCNIATTKTMMKNLHWLRLTAAIPENFYDT
jgi:type III secretion system FlhB-like substrate exporter